MFRANLESLNEYVVDIHDMRREGKLFLKGGIKCSAFHIIVRIWA